MPTSRRLDTIDDHAQVAERVRKLEVMPQPGGTGDRWTPSKEDLHAIAGHVYMLGCFRNPTELEGGAGGVAHPGQAAQVLWALLDQRGFANQAEGQDWTAFLTRLGALPAWSTYRGGPFTMNNLPPSGATADEARAAFWPPWLRTVYTRGHTPPEIPHQARAMYWAGLPDRGTWAFAQAGGDIGGAFDTVIVPDGGDNIKVWDQPVDAPSFNDGMWWNVADNPVLKPETFYGDPATWCGNLEPHYDSATMPGEPFPYNAGNLQCPNNPSAHPINGQITRARLLLPMDLYLLCPPRLVSVPDTDSYTHPTFGDQISWQNGPGWEWLETGIAAILADHYHVASFYSSHLPIAYAAKNQTGHHRHRQLQVYVGYRGRVEAYLERDCVILKGRVRWWGNIRPQTPIFEWPLDWPKPPFPDALHIAHTDTGELVPLHYQFVGGTPSRAIVSVFNNWAVAESITGPLTIILDGVVMPIPAITGAMPSG